MEMTSLLQNTIIRYIPCDRNLSEQLFSKRGLECILFIFFLNLIIGCGVTMKYRSSFSTMNIDFSPPTSQQNFLDGCRYVYIDLGTNIGVQIRKLYEPHLYPNAAVLPLFKQVFGNHSNEVCSVGFEANPVHDNYLKEFEDYCAQRNWRVKIYTSTAVSIAEKNVTFYIEANNMANNQWGASLEARLSSHTGNVTVPSIDIVSWFKKTVLNRKISPSNVQLRVMMKSDIEGHDQVIIANLILSGVYCAIDLIYGEHMNNIFLNAISTLQQFSNSCTTKLIPLDDESYHASRFPFIVSNSTKSTKPI